MVVIVVVVLVVVVVVVACSVVVVVADFVVVRCVSGTACEMRESVQDRCDGVRLR